jgi:hypothetical protein
VVALLQLAPGIRYTFNSFGAEIPPLFAAATKALNSGIVK